MGGREGGWEGGREGEQKKNNDVDKKRLLNRKH